MNIVSAVILCTIVGAVGAIVLVAASKFMAVEEDPRIEEVTNCLAGANCGGCGYAGCADYAKAVVMDGVPCDKCAPGGPKAAAAIAKIMGGTASAVEKKAVSGSCTEKPVSQKACTERAAPSSSSTAAVQRVPARPKQNSTPRSTASTAPQHNSSRPGDSGR